MTSRRIASRGRATAVALIIAVACAIGLAAGASGLLPDESGYRLIRSGLDKGLLVVSPARVATYVVPPASLQLPVLITIPSGGQEATLTGVAVCIQDKSFTFPSQAQLHPQQYTAAEIIQLFEEGSAEVAGIARTGLYRNMVLDVRDLQLQEGDVIPVQITARGTVGGAPVEAALTLQYSILSLPVRTNWYGGDGHVHTAWSDIIEESIAERTSYAASNGHKFIIITDHEQYINDRWSGPNSYVADCNSAQATYGIPVCPAAEIATSPATDSHALGYALKESATTIPNDQTLSPQNLINAINNHNSPYSYAVIAHPYHGTYPWDDWTVTGFRSMELLSQETTAKSQTISKWFELLRNGLSSTITTGRFVVGIGTTDCHYLMAPGDEGFTWVYTSSYGSSNRTAIWDAIRTGRVSASGLCDLGCFSLNSYAQGSVISTTPGSTLTFKVVQQPVTGRKCTKITIYNKNQAPLKTFSNPSTTETTWSMSAPSVDDLYVVKFDLTTTSGTYPSEVWANPIFVNVP